MIRASIGRRLLLVTAGLFTLLGGPRLAAADTPGLLENPQFKDGTKHWSFWARKAPARMSLVKNTAGMPLAVRLDIGEGGSGVFSAETIPVQKNTFYKITVMYRTPKDFAPTTRQIRPAVRAQDGSFLYYVGTKSLPPTFGAWRTERIYFHVDEFAATVNVGLNVSGETWIAAMDVNVVSAVPADEQVDGFIDPPSKPIILQAAREGEKMPNADSAFPDWDYMLGSGENWHDNALIFGLTYNVASLYQTFGQHRLAPIARGISKELQKKYNAPLLGFLYTNAVIERAARRLGKKGRPFLFNPIYEQEMLAEVDNLTKTYGNALWGLFYIDEPNGWVSGSIPVKDKRDAYWQGVDKEVRERYGFGKYGIPSSKNADEPFNWIAYRRWTDDKLYDLLSRVKQRAQQANPDLKLVGVDEMAFAVPRDWERLAQTWDISTGQTQNVTSWGIIGKHRVGFHTKIYRDLTGKPMCPFVQVCRYDQNTTPEFVWDSYSQVIRGGGGSFWINSVEWFDRNLNHPRYTAPDRWQAMLEMADHVRHLPAIIYPQADAAIFYSLDSYAAKATPNPSDRETLSMYYLLGPSAGGWFDFISEPQIERKTRNLSRYRVIYLPLGKYMRANVAKQLEQYVQDGGTLVVTDPNAFLWDDHGNKLTDLRRQLLGVSAEGQIREPMGLKAQSNLLPAQTVNYPVFDQYPQKVSIVSKQATAGMIFANGDPGMVINKLGQGRVIYFTFATSNPSIAESLVWKRLFAHLHQALGCKINQNIWRYELPKPTGMEQFIQAPAPGVCITGNYVERRSGIFTPKNDVNEGGSYSYPIAPSQEGKDGQEIPFATGLLTNRKKAFESLGTAIRRKTVTFKPNEWMVTWKDAKHNLVINLNLNQSYDLTQLALYVSGQMPAATLVSLDKGSEIILGKAAATIPGDNVSRIEIPLTGISKRLQLRFGPINSKAGGQLLIGEMELWGRSVPHK